MLDRTIILRIGLTDDNFSVLNLNPVKTGRNIEKDILHNFFNGSMFMFRPKKAGNTRERVVFYAKNIPRKLLLFQTIESAKRTFSTKDGSRKFLENEKQNSRKEIWGNAFTLSPRSHAKIELIWTRKKSWA